MKKYFVPLITITVVLTLTLSACVVPFRSAIRGSGDIITESREVSGFNRIRLDGAGTLTITQGDVEALQIKTDANVLPELTSDVIGDTLILGNEENWWHKVFFPTNGINYALVVKDLSNITINGAADLNLNNFNVDSLTIEVNGAGMINIVDLTANNFEFEINGTADAELSGKITDLSVIVNGMGHVNAGDLQTDTADIEINGLGSSTVWAVNSLSISISGGGSLSYYGYPTISQDVSGAGDVVSLGEK